MSTESKVVLTGIKPTGTPHLGNYVGAIKPLVQLANAHKNSYVFVADYHSLNQQHDPQQLKHNTVEVAATLLAFNIPSSTILYRQSDIPEIFELMVILASVTPKGFLNRAHAYKTIVDSKETDPDAGVNMGLYTYPLLMAADILLFNTNFVPAGKDQVQHIEIAKDIAEYFNRTYGEVLTIPQPYFTSDSSVIPGLDGRKMSKSYNNTIPLFGDEKAQRKLIMKIATDSKTQEEPKNPNESTMFQLYKQFGSEQEIEELKQLYVNGGMGYGVAKQKLFEVMQRELSGPKAKFERIVANPETFLYPVLESGAKQARKQASETLQRVKKAIGIRL